MHDTDVHAIDYCTVDLPELNRRAVVFAVGLNERVFASFSLSLPLRENLLHVQLLHHVHLQLQFLFGTYTSNSQ